VADPGSPPVWRQHTRLAARPRIIRQKEAPDIEGYVILRIADHQPCIYAQAESTGPVMAGLMSCKATLHE
jgi:hypothetical protein